MLYQLVVSEVKKSLKHLRLRFSKVIRDITDALNWRLNLGGDELQVGGHIDLVHGQLGDRRLHARRELSGLPELKKNEQKHNGHEAEDVGLHLVDGLHRYSGRLGLLLLRLRRRGDGLRRRFNRLRAFRLGHFDR